MKNISLVHWVVGVTVVLMVILTGVFLNLTTALAGVLMGLAALVFAPFLYMLIRKYPKHDDDIHYHIKNEKRRIRGGLNTGESEMRQSQPLREGSAIKHDRSLQRSNMKNLDQ